MFALRSRWPCYNSAPQDNPAPLRLAQKRRLSHFRAMQRQEALTQAVPATSTPGHDTQAVMQESTTPAGSPRGLDMVLVSATCLRASIPDNTHEHSA